MKHQINFENHHPYFKTIVEYHWSNDLPVIYTNEQGQLIQHWSDGKIELLEDIEEFDKRYDEPFEDDGAYADD